jgi:hypothetical protein
MISLASLSAFSSSAIPSGPTPVGRPGAGHVQPVRSTGALPPIVASPTAGIRTDPGNSGQGGEGGSPPSRSLPRGSLVDLSV